MPSNPIICHHYRNHPRQQPNKWSQFCDSQLWQIVMRKADMTYDEVKFLSRAELIALIEECEA